MESLGCRPERGVLGREGCQRARARRVLGPPAARWLTLPARGWGCRCVWGVGASATPGHGPHTCRMLRASSPSAFSLEFPSEGNPPSLITSRAGLAPPQGGGAGGALGSGSNCQHSPASATSKHRKQVGLVDPTPHKGSPHLEGGSIQTRKATSSGSLVGSHLPSLACYEVGSSGCQEQERWHCKDEIWVI